MRLGVHLGGHTHAWEDLVELVREAEALGYASVFVDGDVAMLSRRSEADCLDGWTVATSLLALTSRIEIGSMRLVHHWNAARLAQALASAERLAPGRLRFLISIGDRPSDARFGLPDLSPGERIAWLDETLDAVRALLRGETVSRCGRFVRLNEARVRPTPAQGRIEVAIAGRGPRLLELVATHADIWDVNLPPLPERVARAAEQLAAACARRGRDPGEIRRSMFLFARAEPDRDRALAAFRRLNPWFRSIPDAELAGTLVAGEPQRCRDRIREIADQLDLWQPILDLSGLPAKPARELMQALSPTD